VAKRSTISLYALLLGAGSATLMPAQTGGFGGMNGFGGMGLMNGAGFNRSDGRGAAFVPFVNLFGNYSTDLTPLTTESVQSNGLNRRGAGITAGAQAYKNWQRMNVGFNYAGAYRYVDGVRNLNTTSHIANLGFNRQLTRKMSFSLGQFGGTAIGGYGLGAGFAGLGGLGRFGGMFSGMIGNQAFGDPSFNGIVDAELFDNRVNFYGSSGQLSYTPSMRWQIGFGGGGNFVRRKGAGGMNSAVASAQAGYRISRSGSVFASYSHMMIMYPNMFGDAQGDSVNGGISWQFGPRTHVGFSAGVFRGTSTFIGRVPLDPIIAALLGQTSVSEIRNSRRLGGGFNAFVGRSFRRATLSGYFSRGMTPGNGVVLFGIRDTAGVALGLNRIGPISVGFSGGYSRISSMVQPGLVMSSASGTMRTGYRLARGLAVSFGTGYRVANLTGPFQRNQFFVNIGIGWSPGEYDIPFL